MKPFIGTAGWSLARKVQEDFPSEGSHLRRYSQIFNAVEINSSFYQNHQAKTYVRWAQTTPEHFRFSLKLHQKFTHDKNLKFLARDLKMTLDGMKMLGDKFHVLLLQFPGSLKFHRPSVERLYTFVRKNFIGKIVIEPRNISWLQSESITLLKHFKISKVLADPERCPSESKLNFGNIIYHRLHGNPVIYRSSYSQEFLRNIFQHVNLRQEMWCIFDNTTLGHATSNALDLKQMFQ
jgi:uncharacterized protein YecE (DUF72 family)